LIVFFFSFLDNLLDNMLVKRGALIIFEGLDRVGKTTQSNLLLNYLKNDRHIQCDRLAFPKRDTKIGELIDSYLKCKQDYDDHTIHLLFSANRWECSKMMIEKLLNGCTLIVDRYVYSGIAFSHAKQLDYEWCRSCDIGLPKPDLVLFMNRGKDTNCIKLNGDERYETREFQRKAEKCYEKFQNEVYWHSINVIDEEKCSFRSIDDIQNQIRSKVLNVIEKIGDNNKIERLWTTDNC